jgi:hypothetical protein
LNAVARRTAAIMCPAIFISLPRVCSLQCPTGKRAVVRR